MGITFPHGLAKGWIQKKRRQWRRFFVQMEPQVGIEPTTARLRIECSTPELLWQLRYVHALARIRTATPCGTTPSRWRVYQFHHQGAALR